MSGTTDWEITFILSIFALISGFGFYYYQSSFDAYGHPVQFNLSYTVSDNGSITGITSNNVDGLDYINSLKIEQPDGTPLFIKRLFGTLFVVFVSILGWRLLRSGGG